MGMQKSDSTGSRVKPRIGVLGCGGWGKNIIRTLERVYAVAAIADPGEDARTLASEIAPGATVYHDPSKVIDDPTIDAIMIATPAQTHFELAKRAILAGKDVFVEKPLTIEPEESQALTDLAAKHGRVLMVGHLLEYHPAILKLRELIDSGELGEIRYVISNRLNLGKIRTHENALWSFAPHDIAVLLRLISGDPIQVVCTGGGYVSPNVADVTVTQLLFSNGTRGHIFVSWLHPYKEQKLVIVGSKKMASFDDVARELVLYDQRVDWCDGHPIPVKGEGTPVEFDSTSPLDLECLHFVDAVAKGTSPRTDGHDGVKVLNILHAAQRSMLLNGSPVSLDAPPSSIPQEGDPVRTAESAATAEVVVREGVGEVAGVGARQ
tara:strand:+ start:164660 stop:165796 length:1137 start_codon:yes stop_codon:yes gene_type:complete